MMHVQSCCFAHQTYCLFAVLVVVTFLVANDLFCLKNTV